LLDQLQREESSAGLPMLFVQTLAMFSEATEMRALAGVGPKVCVASWLAGNLIHAGVPATEAVCVLNGVDHRTFRVVQPIDDRAPRIAMNYNPHPFKNGAAGIEALEQVGRDLGTPSIVYGTRHPAIPPRGGLQFADSPGQAEIAATILGQSSIYLQPSIQEGFGLSAVEAMACGCALVTTANGGSADYAVDGETAVVCDPEPGAMADAVASLVRDDNRRISIARNGVAYVKDFTWARSASQLTKLADAYLAEPAAFRHGRAVQLAPSVRHLV
jgi:glycosyltransferase involved in cell wall biosynthesis